MALSPEEIGARVAAVHARVAAACARAGREPASVRLVAASKAQPPEAVRAAHAAGQRVFGENYVQELVGKADALEDLEDLEWRFIGHLQRNKAKDVVRVARAVETVDSPRLAEALARRLPEGRVLDVLLEVNVGGEAQKAGVAPEALGPLVDAVRGLPALRLVGLMTVPPPADDPEGSRPWFRALADLAGRWGLPELSMGMTGDFEVAIEEGATLVRVGTAIFGPRPPR